MILPALDVTLIEARERSLEFIETCRDEPALEGLRVVPGRAESLAHDPGLRAAFDTVVTRGLAPLPLAIEIASGFARPGGFVMVHCPSGTSSHLAAHGPALSRLGVRFGRVGGISIPSIPDSPVPFAQFEQIKAAGERYPRAWKAMKRRPLWPVEH
jgi:16S rRNA (guanine527-N7)-methyltransferase